MAKRFWLWKQLVSERTYDEDAESWAREAFGVFSGAELIFPVWHVDYPLIKAWINDLLTFCDNYDIQIALMPALDMGDEDHWAEIASMADLYENHPSLYSIGVNSEHSHLHFPANFNHAGFERFNNIVSSRGIPFVCYYAQNAPTDQTKRQFKWIAHVNWPFGGHRRTLYTSFDSILQQVGISGNFYDASNLIYPWPTIPQEDETVKEEITNPDGTKSPKRVGWNPESIFYYLDVAYKHDDTVREIVAFAQLFGNKNEVFKADVQQIAEANNFPYISAWETPLPGYTLTVNVIGDGVVTKSPDQTFYTEGTNVTLTAIPHPDRDFEGWSGDLSGITSPATLTMNANTTVQANFSAFTPPPPINKIVTAWVAEWATIEDWNVFLENADCYAWIGNQSKRATLTGDIIDQPLTGTAHPNAPAAHALGVSFIPSQVSTEYDKFIIADPVKRATSISSIVGIIQAEGLDGWDMNMEYWDPEGNVANLSRADKANMSIYIEELAAALQEIGKICSVTLPPRNSDDDDAHWPPANAYDWARIGQLMNSYPNLYVRIMAYRGDQPDDTAPISMVQSIALHAKSKMRSDRIILGMAWWGYENLDGNYEDPNDLNNPVYRIGKVCDLVNELDLRGVSAWSLHDGDYGPVHNVYRAKFGEAPPPPEGTLLARCIDNMGQIVPAFISVNGDSGTGQFTKTYVAGLVKTVTFHALAGYELPVPNVETVTIIENQTVTVDAVYVTTPTPPPTPFNPLPLFVIAGLILSKKKG